MKLNTFSTKLILNTDIPNKSFYDFVIDGKSLLDLLKKHEYIPCIGPGTNNYKQELIEELTLKKLSKLGGNRYPLFICADCGDLNCGFVSAIIEEEHNMIVWRDFKKGDPMKLTHVGPYYFEKNNYMKNILNTL
ncbi:oxidoreductase [Paenibacillus aceris]|uniref:Nucleic-acid-binding Zn-ribbon protein n=1 Tax=Paenibacillus aceris TaxID=869555 RepID=A0ABS4IAX7_9BACL|nr:oxidoreductase [Paenibacillus aceris]MBP1967631.1 putative nucleic-acid-binding Zn-ribbon protein [Paenibacillus aceris]NHW37500.1 oxidoreductase [Paenibacillus aceris]